jgi:hypothetical protein
LSVAFRTPVKVGLKVTEIVHFPPAGKLLPQLLVCEKSLLLIPMIAMLVMFSVTF